MASNRSTAAFRSIRALFTAGTVGGLTDQQLLERFTARDGEGAELAFGSLVERHGQMGNIGFPSTAAGIRHFRQMLDQTVQRVTTDEVDRLINSLSAGQ